ncbi:hypothetical protein TNCV_4052581 [Trichonephila clavipes]|nr:hypothetical protein TNCV_4052581 [Trichonephila clavipes]
MRVVYPIVAKPLHQMQGRYRMQENHKLSSREASESNTPYQNTAQNRDSSEKDDIGPLLYPYLSFDLHQRIVVFLYVALSREAK